MFDFTEPFGSCIFCDDVRQEIGGKASYMGVYYGALYVPTFPVVLSKFCVVAIFYEPKGMALARTWPVTVRVFAPWAVEPIISGEIGTIPEQAIAAATSSELPDDPDVPKLLSAQVAFAMAPFVVDRPGRIRVRATYKENEILKLGSLRIEHTPQDVTPSASDA